MASDPTVLIVTANIGGFEEPKRPVAQASDGIGVIDYKVVTETLPSRKSLSPRLRAKLPKMFAWDLYPGFDRYIWMDASMWMVRPDGVLWFLDQIGSGEIALFRHPSRTSIQQEADYLRVKMEEPGPDREYLCARYEGEDLAGQLRAIAQPGFVDDRLYAGTAFCYRPTAPIQAAMREWWWHTSRFHCNDQLSLPFALWTTGCDVRVIDENIFRASRLTRRRGYDPERRVAS